MIGDALDLDVPATVPHDAFNHPDVDPLGIEHATLLDVQFEIRCDVTPLSLNGGERSRIASQDPYSLANGLAAATHDVQVMVGQPPADGTAADEPAFLILEDHDFQWMTQRNVVLREYLRDFDGTQGTNVAVVVAAVRHGVDMRSHHETWQARVSAGAPPDQVACGINTHTQ